MCHLKVPVCRSFTQELLHTHRVVLFHCYTFAVAVKLTRKLICQCVDYNSGSLDRTTTKFGNIKKKIVFVMSFCLHLGHMTTDISEDYHICQLSSPTD